MKTVVVRCLLLVWTLGALALGAALVAFHTPFSLAAKRPEAQAAAAMPPAEDAATTAGWTATHFIASGCGCSRDVANRLLARGRLTTLAAERVVFVGTPEFDPSEFDRLGFAIDEVAAADVGERYGIEAAPLMRVRAPDGAEAYLGGYFETMARTRALDEDIVVALRRGESPRPLPPFGCALSEELRSAQDPLGLKYR